MRRGRARPSPGPTTRPRRWSRNRRTPRRRRCAHTCRRRRAPLMRPRAPRLRPLPHAACRRRFTARGGKVRERAGERARALYVLALARASLPPRRAPPAPAPATLPHSAWRPRARRLAHQDAAAQPAQDCRRGSTCHGARRRRPLAARAGGWAAERHGRPAGRSRPCRRGGYGCSDSAATSARAAVAEAVRVRAARMGGTCFNECARSGRDNDSAAACVGAEGRTARRRAGGKQAQDRGRRQHGHRVRVEPQCVY